MTIGLIQKRSRTSPGTRVAAMHTGNQSALAYLLPLGYLESTGRTWVTQTSIL